MNNDLEVLEKIPTQPGMGRSIIQHDRRSRMFRAVDLPIVGQEPRDRSWIRGRAYDQGFTSTCVAQTGKGMINTKPNSARYPYSRRSRFVIDDWYDGAQRNDEWVGESPSYEGTSALGLCRYLTQIGVIAEYRWCFGLQDVLRTLSWVGPVGIGVYWKTGMFHPDDRGRIEPSGANEGGHEVELIGVDVDQEEVIGMNSWGLGWGDRGRFRMKWHHLEDLLAEDGDAFVIVR